MKTKNVKNKIKIQKITNSNNKITIKQLLKTSNSPVPTELDLTFEPILTSTPRLTTFNSVSDISKRKRRNTSSTSSVSKYSKDDIPPDISIPQKKNLAHYSYPEHEATLKREPLCPHLKRNARDKPLGHAFILQAHASSFAKYFHLDNTTLYCLNAVAPFKAFTKFQV